MDRLASHDGGLSAAGTAQPPPSPDRDFGLFLDVDGTLVEFARHPDEVRVELTLVELLGRALDATGGAVALISGRPIAQLDRLFAPLVLPAAGVHGDERRDARGRFDRHSQPDERLRPARETLRALASALPGVIFEDKRSALAINYRAAPGRHDELRKAFRLLTDALLPDYELLEGNHILELKPRSFSKALAIEAFLGEPPFAGRQAVFLGDDVTDLGGFAVVEEHGGIAIAVGERVSAPWRLANPEAARRWLRSVVGQREVAR